MSMLNITQSILLQFSWPPITTAVNLPYRNIKGGFVFFFFGLWIQNWLNIGSCVFRLAWMIHPNIPSQVQGNTRGLNDLVSSKAQSLSPCWGKRENNLCPRSCNWAFQREKMWDLQWRLQSRWHCCHENWKTHALSTTMSFSHVYCPKFILLPIKIPH